MPVKIRLMRIGAKKRPFYRVVAVDERRKRTGRYIELLGTYNPLTEPKEIILKNDRIEWWLRHGAVLSDGYLRVTKQAPQKPPRKPKKENKKESSAVSNQPSEKTAQEEKPIKEDTEETGKSEVESATQEKAPNKPSESAEVVNKESAEPEVVESKEERTDNNKK